MSKKIQCDICGKLMDPDQEQSIYEIHKIYQISVFSYKKGDDHITDICSSCYNKINHIISEKKWEDNMIPNEVLKKCLSNKEE